MKRKGNLILGKRNLVVVLLALMLIISSVLMACGASTETIEEVAATEKEEAVQLDVEEIIREEVVEETASTEEVAETTEGVVGPQSVAQWAKTFDETNPKLTIWNDILKEGVIIENGQRYVLREGDILVICTKEKENGLSIYSSISSEDFKSLVSERYVSFQFLREILEETLFEISVTVEGIEYPFSITLISENAAATASEGLETTKMSGKEWAATLEFDEPKLVAWNDETGTREVIETGGKYVMQQGDVLGVYHPEEFYVFTVSPVDFAGSLTDLYKVTVMDYQLPSESQDINLEVEVMDNNNEFIKFNYVVTTP